MKKIIILLTALAVFIVPASALGAASWSHAASATKSHAVIQRLHGVSTQRPKAHVANAVGDGVCTLHADLPTYSSGNAHSHAYLNSCNGYFNIPMHGQSCIQANGGGGWYNVSCGDTGQFNGAGWNASIPSSAPCRYRFRSWAWSKVSWLNGAGVWQSATNSLVSGSNYRC